MAITSTFCYDDEFISVIILHVRSSGLPVCLILSFFLRFKIREKKRKKIIGFFYVFSCSDGFPEPAAFFLQRQLQVRTERIEFSVLSSL